MVDSGVGSLALRLEFLLGSDRRKERRPSWGVFEFSTTDNGWTHIYDFIRTVVPNASAITGQDMSGSTTSISQPSSADFTIASRMAWL